MSSGVVLQAVIAGLAVGAVYGLVALGFSLLHRLARVIPFQQGDLVVGAVLLAVLAVVGRAPVALAPSAAASVALVVLAIAVGAGLSIAAYAVAVRPFLARPGGRLRADELGWVAGTLTAGLVIRSVVGLALPAEGYAVPDPFHLPSGVFLLPGGGTLPQRLVGVLAIGVVVGVAVERLVVRSRAGRAMRAVADDPGAAALCGVPVERVLLVAFAVAGLLAALAGLLDTPATTTNPDDGVLLGLFGLAAALLGRLGSLRGALVAGPVVGVAQQLAVAAPAVGPAYSAIVPLGLLLVAVLVRPEGRWARRSELVE